MSTKLSLQNELQPSNGLEGSTNKISSRRGSTCQQSIRSYSTTRTSFSDRRRPLSMLSLTTTRSSSVSSKKTRPWVRTNLKDPVPLSAYPATFTRVSRMRPGTTAIISTGDNQFLPEAQESLTYIPCLAISPTAAAPAPTRRRRRCATRIRRLCSRASL